MHARPAFEPPRRLLVALALGFAVPAGAAPRTCNDDINKALPIAHDIPNWKGRNAVLQNIERARDSWHEGDEDGCREQIAEVLALLCPAGKPRGKRDPRCEG